jgi:hypothetical protein
LNSASSQGSTVGGGSNNSASGDWTTVCGGLDNLAEGLTTSVAGGESNEATSDRASVGGGRNNQAWGTNSRVGGGQNNFAPGNSSTVAGGGSNKALDDNGTVGGGFNNEASGRNSTIAGGFFNVSGGADSTVGGGTANQALGLQSTVSGGENNMARGNFSTVSGGLLNCAGGMGSWAGGTRAKVRRRSFAIPEGSACDGVPANSDPNVRGDQGTFIWADSQDQDFVSGGPDQFLVRAQGGIGFGGTPGDHFDIQTPVAVVPGDGVPEDGAFRVRLDGATKFRVFANGGVGVGSSFSGPGVPENGLSVLGAIRVGALGSAGTNQLCRNASNEIALCSSSARYKGEIEALDLALDTVLALRPVTYLWTSDDSADIGFVAEDIAAIDERLITRNADGQVEGVCYGRLTAVLANAVQEMHQREGELKAGLSELQEQVHRINAENLRLQYRLATLESQQATELESLKAELVEMREILRSNVASLAANGKDQRSNQGAGR